MRRAAAVAALLALASLQAAAAPEPVADKPSIIAVGDGLTESAFSSANMGWGLLMQEKYVRKVRRRRARGDCWPSGGGGSMPAAALRHAPLPCASVGTTAARGHGRSACRPPRRSLLQADVLNRGFGGFFTPWMVDYMLPSLFDAAHPTMAVIFLGVKDSLTQAVSG